MEYPVSEIISIVNGKPASDPYFKRVISDILIDSRKLISPDNCLFFALIKQTERRA